MSLDLEPIRARLAQVTSPPWKRDFHLGSHSDTIRVFDATGKYVVHKDDWWDNGDLDFIAHAPTDIAALLAEVERLREVEHDYDLVRAGIVEFR